MRRTLPAMAERGCGMTHLPDASYSLGGMHLSEPLVDPADAEAMAAEPQVMSKAAEPGKD